MSEGLFGNSIDVSLLTDRALSCRGEVYFNPRTGARFDPNEHSVDMSNVTLDMTRFDMSRDDVAESVSGMLRNWSFMLGLPDNYLHVLNNGRNVDVGVSVVDRQTELEVAFTKGLSDVSASLRERVPIRREPDVSVDELFGNVSRSLSEKRDASCDFGLGF